MKLLDNFIKNSALFVPLFLFGISSASLSAAYIAEYGFGLLPCILCLYQRVPFAVIIVLSILVIPFRFSKKALRALLILSSIAFFVGGSIAIFQVGVEQGYWSGTEDCGDNIVAKTTEELLEALKKAPTKRCDEPEFWFLGITMAGWNILYSYFLSIFSLFLFRRI